MKKIICALLIMLSIFYASPAFAFGYGIPKTSNHNIPHPGEKIANLIAKYQGYYIGNTEEKTIYLTFDNGYENGYTIPILDALKEENVPATFFVTGHYLQGNTDIIKRMVAEGHIVGNHTWHHYDLTHETKQTIADELALVEKEYHAITGQEMEKWMRPPRGIMDERMLAVTKELGYTNVLWSLAYDDWNVDHQRGADYAYQTVMDRIHNGAIILLHAVSKDNAEAMKSIIVDLKSAGYTFKSLHDLLIE